MIKEQKDELRTLAQQMKLGVEEEKQQFHISTQIILAAHDSKIEELK